MIVARELDIRTVDTISVKSYAMGGGAADVRGEAQVIKSPDGELMGDGEGILVVDDLVDSRQDAGAGARALPEGAFRLRLRQARGRSGRRTPTSPG